MDLVSIVYKLTSSSIFAGISGRLLPLLSCYQICRLLISWLRREVQVDVHDPIYDEVIGYIEHKQWTTRWTKLVAATKRSTGNSETASVRLSPGFTRQWLPQLWLSIERDDSSLKIWALGRSTSRIEAFILEAHNHYANTHRNDITIHRAARGEIIVNRPWSHIWTKAPRRAKDLSTVILPGEVKEDILRDIETYFRSEEQYHNRGIPYHRGYLFHGVPRTGKTSLALALASHFQLDVYIVTLSDGSLDDITLETIFSKIPRGCMLLLEDIDTALEKRLPDLKDGIKKTGISLGGLLNVIDGAHAPEGHILIMTTNHPDKLDSALLAPGRTDMVIEFKTVTEDQAERMFKKFFESKDELARVFSTKLRGHEKTPADIQGYLMSQDGAREASENLKAWLEPQGLEKKEIDRGLD